MQGPPASRGSDITKARCETTIRALQSDPIVAEQLAAKGCDGDGRPQVVHFRAGVTEARLFLLFLALKNVEIGCLAGFKTPSLGLDVLLAEVYGALREFHSLAGDVGRLHSTGRRNGDLCPHLPLVYPQELFLRQGLTLCADALVVANTLLVGEVGADEVALELHQPGSGTAQAIVDALRAGGDAQVEEGGGAIVSDAHLDGGIGAALLQCCELRAAGQSGLDDIVDDEGLGTNAELFAGCDVDKSRTDFKAGEAALLLRALSDTLLGETNLFLIGGEHLVNFEEGRLWGASVFY